jgi:predicted DCC family thiol-disulfide oxidoreductase YuxK
MPVPLLLFNGECAVCRAIAGWVKTSMVHAGAAPRLTEQPIGDDPAVLRALNPGLDIWDAYATIHLLMPDGSMKRGGEAVAEVLRRLPNTRWFAGAFGARIFGVRPFQLVLDGGYALLADVRPLLGCESCGTTNAWVRSTAAAITWLRAPFDVERHPRRTRHRSAAKRRAS